jgi:hypothetical protein
MLTDDVDRPEGSAEHAPAGGFDAPFLLRHPSETFRDDDQRGGILRSHRAALSSRSAWLAEHRLASVTTYGS